MELRDYVRIIRRSWLWIVAWTLGGLFAALGFSLLITPKYESTTQLYISVRGADSDTSDLVQGSNFAQQAVASYAEVATSTLVLERVIEELSLDESVQSLAPKIEVSSPSGTVLMNISVTDPDPQYAADVTNATGATVTDVIEDEIEASNGDDEGPIEISTLDPAPVANSPVSPRVALNGALGLLTGFAIAVGSAILRTILDTRFHVLEDLEHIVDAPVLGAIAHDAKIDKRPLIVHSDRMNPRAESFRGLRTNLRFVATEDESRVLVISSSVPGEGKTTTAANLAVALAETGASVALVDADLRKPSIANIMGIEGGVGLTDILAGEATLRDVVQHWGRAELVILPAGRMPPNPSELLGSKAMQQTLNELGEAFDYVVVDTPPVLPVTDAAVVSEFASGLILVAAAESTKQQELKSAVDTLEVSGVRLLGLIATKLSTKGPEGYTYGAYKYGEGSDDGEHLEVPERGVSQRTSRRHRSRPEG